MPGKKDKSLFLMRVNTDNHLLFFKNSSLTIIRLDLNILNYEKKL